MFDIFRFWYPQTSATIDERLQALDILSKREPEVAWTLLLDLIPEGQDTAIASVKPRWRDYDSSQARQVTDQDIERQVEWAAARLIEIAKGHPEKWPLLLKDLRKLPPFAQGETLKWLRELEVESLPENARTEIWEKVRELVQEHRFFHDAWWAMPKPIVDTLAEVEQKLIPIDPVVRYKWLFHPGTTHAFGNMETPYEERERLEAEAQREAVREVFENAGLSGVLELGLGALFHVGAKIGTYLAQVGLLKNWQELLPEKLVSEAENERAIALGYAIGRRTAEGDSWAQSLPLEQWTADAVGEFGLSLPFGRATWQQLRSRKPEAESAYWRRVSPSVWQLNDDDLEEAVSALLQNGRPMAAVQALSMAIHAHKKPSWKIVVDTVDLALTSPETPAGGLSNPMLQFEFAELMKYLQADPTGDQERLAMLEWRLLPLTGYSGFQPKLLHSELCKRPAFFGEVLSAIYPGKGEARSQKPDPVKENLSRAAAKLLDSWVGIPGTKTDGSVDSDILNAWITEARKTCTTSGRAEVCDVKIGEQLSYAPVDADGSWPCKAVRDVFETITTDEVLRGFETGTLNQRGVTTRGLNDGGAQERDLVRNYRGYADRYKVAWPRTALVLRRIVDYYEAHAKWQDARVEARE
jgi:hypothetical protein